MTDGREDRVETTYEYEKLASDQIRVLVLLAGDDEDDLRGYFETVFLDDRPVYKALSYAWGQPLFSHTLHVVGGGIAVTHTVQRALRRLRDAECPFRLWIDAICINQQNIAEKNLQVAMMAQVYSEAQEWYMKWFDWRTSGISWVDPATGMQEWKSWRVQAQHIACPNCRSWFWLNPGSLSNGLQKLRAIWSAQWFTRLWVIQEAASSVRLTFMYGQHSSDFIDVKRTAETTIHLLNAWVEVEEGASLDRAVRRAYSTMAHISRLRNPLPSPDIVETKRHSVASAGVRSMDLRLPQALVQETGGRLLFNLVWCAGLSVSVAHDLVYAIRSTSRVEDDPTLEPAYGLPLTELWKRVAIHTLTQRPQSSIILSLACIKTRPDQVESSDANEPSWAPYFRDMSENSWERYRSRFLSFYRLAPLLYHDGWATTKEVQLTVDSCDPDILRSHAVILFDIDSNLDLQKREFVNVTYAIHRQVLTDSVPRYPWRNVRHSVRWHSLYQCHGNFDIGGKHGDIVCLLHGCPYPFVLRLRDDGFYRLIEEIHGLHMTDTWAPWPSDEEHVISIGLK